MPPHDRSDPGHGSGAPKYPGTFLQAFREALAGINWQITRWLGDAVECRDAEGEQQTVGLENLFRRARQAPRQEWPALIADFLNNVNEVDRDDLPKELAAVAERILPRLSQPLLAGLEEAKRPWAQPLGDTGLCVHLVIDYPKCMSYVSEELIAESGRPGADWLEQARTNLRARTPADCIEAIDEDSGIRICAVGDAYDAARALLLDDLLPESAAAGCFVAPLSRDRLFVLPVTLPALRFVHLLKVLAEKNYKTTPYVISDEVFWVHQGTWRLLPIELGGQQVNVVPPAELVEVLNLLASERGPDAGAENVEE
jgi:hypothetical protein